MSIYSVIFFRFTSPWVFLTSLFTRNAILTLAGEKRSQIRDLWTKFHTDTSVSGLAGILKSLGGSMSLVRLFVVMWATVDRIPQTPVNRSSIDDTPSSRNQTAVHCDAQQTINNSFHTRAPPFSAVAAYERCKSDRRKKSSTYYINVSFRSPNHEMKMNLCEEKSPFRMYKVRSTSFIDNYDTKEKKRRKKKKRKSTRKKHTFDERDIPVSIIFVAPLFQRRDCCSLRSLHYRRRRTRYIFSSFSFRFCM